ncbi:MAG: HNH endonuclease family protein, partial [Candidatus Micrarchaeaceae archaeon]
ALMLAKSNADLRSSGFDKKKEVYKNSPYETTRQIASVVEWGEAQIDERQKILAELALKAWPL